MVKTGFHNLISLSTLALAVVDDRYVQETCPDAFMTAGMCLLGCLPWEYSLEICVWVMDAIKVAAQIDMSFFTISSQGPASLV